MLGLYTTEAYPIADMIISHPRAFVNTFLPISQALTNRHEKENRLNLAIQTEAPPRGFEPLFQPLEGRVLGLYTTEEYKAGELGFEPRQYESESQVLPLHHSPSLYSVQPAFAQLRGL